jgi:cytochrome c-type biogenesis protein
MIDPLDATLRAVTLQSPAALGLVFLAGVVTSIGPCIAPRYVAIAAIVGRDRRPIVPTLAFVLGLIGSYVALGFAGGLLGTVWSLSSTIYVVLAAGLIGSGCIALARAVPSDPIAQCCARPTPAGGAQRSLGAIFLLGAASAFVLSPCCMPIVAAIVATSTAIGKPLLGAALLLSYAAGHALPLLFAGGLGSVVRRFVPRAMSGQGPAIVSAVLMLALGIYYAVLA